MKKCASDKPIGGAIVLWDIKGRHVVLKGNFYHALAYPHARIESICLEHLYDGKQITLTDHVPTPVDMEHAASGMPRLILDPFAVWQAHRPA